MPGSARQYSLPESGVDVAAHLAHVATQVRRGLLGVVGGERVEVGVERHLGVHDERPAARETDHEVGPLGTVLAREVDLLLEVAVLDHAGELDGSLEVQLAPLAADVRLAQRRGERAGLPTEQVGAVPHVVDLLAQLPLPGRPLLLDVHQPLVQPVQAVTEHGLVGPAVGQRTRELGVTAAPGPAERHQRAEQEPDHQGEEGKQDVHAVSVAAGTDRT